MRFLWKLGLGYPASAGVENAASAAYAFAMGSKHSKILADSAKQELASLGFRQKGRSRLWLADHGTWLNVVEFTPDRWTKGVSLVNATHWLWAGRGVLAFHEPVYSGKHAQFESDEQFAVAVEEIAREAARNAKDMQKQFATLEGTVTFAVDRARTSPDRMARSWWGYQAGIASGLSGNFEAAEAFLTGITDERVTEHAIPLLATMDDPDEFLKRVNELVATQRHALGLPALDQEPF